MNEGSPIVHLNIPCPREYLFHPDWAARLPVGGTHMSFFIVKQLPV